MLYLVHHTTVYVIPALPVVDTLSDLTTHSTAAMHISQATHLLAPLSVFAADDQGWALYQ